MYAGYAWLTNNVRLTWQMRLVPIAAMAGFLTMALAIPEVFGAGGADVRALLYDSPGTFQAKKAPR